MTEPDVASSATPPTSRPGSTRDGDDYVINGRKWWTSGALDPRCKLLIVMGKTDPDAAPHRQQSMVLVPHGHARASPIVRDLPVFGYHDQHGHGEIASTTCGCPVEQPARRGGRRLRRSRRPASVPAASTTACAPSAWPSARWS